MQQPKFSSLAQVGQTIRGHDFMPAIAQSAGESYVQGVVVETHCRERGCLDYKVRVTERKLAGEHQPAEVGNVGYIPHGSLLEWEGRIELVTENAPAL